VGLNRKLSARISHLPTDTLLLTLSNWQASIYLSLSDEGKVAGGGATKMNTESSGDRIRILLVEDDKFCRKGIKVVLRRVTNSVVIAETASGNEAIELAREHKPDLVIMDIGLPDLNGIEAVSRILAWNPAMRIIMISGHLRRWLAHESLKIGAAGYVYKMSIQDGLTEAVAVVMKGDRYVSPEVVNLLADEDCDLRSLSTREWEIARLLVRGKDSHLIARELNITVNTVNTHLRSIMRKLRVKNAMELQALLYREGLAQVDMVPKSRAVSRPTDA
jgi:DNA-binding NarL/FixJ family response regulator